MLTGQSLASSIVPGNPPRHVPVQPNAVTSAAARSAAAPGRHFRFALVAGGVIMLTVIHAVFVLSALGVAYVDRLARPAHVAEG
jgi:hypothetical protein